MPIWILSKKQMYKSQHKYLFEAIYIDFFKELMATTFLHVKLSDSFFPSYYKVFKAIKSDPLLPF